MFSFRHTYEECIFLTGLFLACECYMLGLAWRSLYCILCAFAIEIFLGLFVMVFSVRVLCMLCPIDVAFVFRKSSHQLE